MKKEYLLNLDKYFKNLDICFAHKKNQELESLREHMSETIDAFLSISKKKKLEKVVDEGLLRMGKNKDLNQETKKIIKKLFINAIYLHDIGKINPKMQIEKFNNNKIKTIINSESIIEPLNTHHSLISAVLYIETMLRENQEEIMKIANKSQADGNLINLCVFTFAYIIASHHSNLNKMEDLTDKIMRENLMSEYFMFYKYNLLFVGKIKNEGPNFINKLLKETSFNEQPFFTIVKLLESLLVSSDFIATHEFFSSSKNEKFQIDSINDIKLNKMIDNFKSTEIFRNIERFEESKKTNEKINISEMNKLRSEMFLESQENYRKNKEKKIFYLESPTGSGKTNTSLNLGLNMLEDHKLEKIIYTFPFNTLCEQTVSVINNTFNQKLSTLEEKILIETINSTTPISLKDSENLPKEEIYKKSLLDRQLWNYDIICTSHISLFNVMFGTSREGSMPFFQLANSLIILDEIQSYENTIWKEMINFFNAYSEILNIKILIMSATLPNLSKLISTKTFDDLTQPLIKNREDYFNNPVFKDRVKFELLFDNKKGNNIKVNNTIDRKNKEESFKKLINKILEKGKERNNLLKKDKKNNSFDGECVSKFLIEFISKKDAQDFEKYLRSNLPSKDVDKKFLNMFNSLKIYEIDGDTSTYERLNILTEVKNNISDNLFLITTQIIEAGVDIDMDLGFKDSSLLDSEEQFAGRVNRNNLKKYCKVFLFNYFDESLIYGSSKIKGKEVKKKDFRLDHTVWNFENFEILENKNYSDFYDKVLSSIERFKEELNNNNIKIFYEKLKRLQFKEVEKHMRLIDENTIQVFIPCEREINGEKINGETVWKEFKELLEDNSISYSEKRIKLSMIRQKLSIFTFQVYGTSLENKKEGISFEYAGGYFYVNNKENGKSKYLDYDNSMKFKRDSFKEDFKTPSEKGEDD